MGHFLFSFPQIHGNRIGIGRQILIPWLKNYNCLQLCQVNCRSCYLFYKRRQHDRNLFPLAAYKKR